MDSGHLSYHLESLGDLITRSPDGKYRLSSFGLAAVELMSGVEEHHPPRVFKSKNRVDFAFKMISVALAVALLSISAYAINLATQTDGNLATVGAVPIALNANQTFSYSVTLTHDALHYTGATGPHGFSIETVDPKNSLQAWTEYSFQFDFWFNTSYYMAITLYDPSGKVLSYIGPLAGPEDPEPGYNFGIGSFATFTAPGMYRIEIQNQKEASLSANMKLHIDYTSHERPLFYEGIAGLFLVALCPIVVLSSWFWMKKRKPADIDR
jgi:hypothetical protein